MIETLFETRWLKLERDGHWDFVRRPHSDHAVGILALTNDRQLVLVEQFRIPVGKRVIELPAGIVDDEPEHRGEPLAATANRELEEETGYRAGRITPLISSPTSPGMTAEITDLFLATELEKVSAGGGVGHEDIQIHHVPIARARGWLAERQAAGCLVDFKIHAALWTADLHDMST
jgi:ADP-ribose pyrophosphatase